jgi:hypothetical protein
VAAPDNSREERKQILRDFMTSTCQIIKVGAPTLAAESIAVLMNAHYADLDLGVKLKLNEKWVNRALYGHESKIPRKVE